MAPEPKKAIPYSGYGSDPNQEWSASYIAKGIMGIIAGLFIHLFLGALYSWGTVNIYVTSYYRMKDSSVSLENNVIAFPLMMFSLGITMRLGIYICEITHPLFEISLSCALLCSSVFISSYMEQIWGFLFFYGIFFGLVMGSLFMVPIVECNKYFPGKKMYVNGAIMGGGGFGSLVFGLFSYSYLNPEKLHPLEGYYMGTPELEEIALKVPSLLRYIALLELCLAVSAVLLITPVCLQNRRVENEQKAKEKEREEENKKNGIVEIAKPIQEPQKIVGQAATLKEAFCSKICVIEAIFVMLVGCGLYMMNGNYKTYVKKYISDDEFLTFIGVAGAVANGCSRFIWNSIFLKTGYKFVMLCLLSLEILVLSTIRFTVHIPGLYLVEIFIINFCLGGLLTTTTTVLQVIYGQRTGSNIAGFYWCCIATTNFFQYFFVSFASPKIGFDGIIYCALGMACAAVPVVIFTTFQGPWMNDTSAVQYFITCQKNDKKEEVDVKQELPSQQVILQNDQEGTEQYEIVLSTAKKLPNPEKDETELDKMSPRDKRVRLEPINKTPMRSDRTDFDNSASKLSGMTPLDSKGSMNELLESGRLDASEVKNQ